MKKNKLGLMATLALVMGVTFTSCQTADLNAPVETPTLGTKGTIATTVSSETKVASMSQEVITSAAEYMPNFDAGSYSVKSMGLQKVSRKNSVIVTIDDPESEVYPKVVTIDFGTEGFIGRRGNVIKGKIIVTVNKLSNTTFSKTYTYDNYSINGNVIKGYKSESCNGVDTWYYTERDTVISVSGKMVVRNSERVHKLIDYNQTPFNFSDDTYSITGVADGINEEGKAYTMKVDAENPLIINTGYVYFIKGKLTLSSEGKTAVVDYGDGTKDSLATITIDGVTTDLDMSK